MAILLSCVHAVFNVKVRRDVTDSFQQFVSLQKQKKILSCRVIKHKIKIK